METGVTQASLLDAIRLAMGHAEGPDDAMTISELTQWIVGDTGRSIERTKLKVRHAIQQLSTDGVVEMVRVRRMAVDGRNALVTGFRFKGARGDG